MQKIFLALVCIVLFSACKKELRTKIYTLKEYNGSGVSGTVTFKETKSTNETIVRLEASGLIPDSTYLAHLHTGTPGYLTSTLIYFLNLKTTTGSIVHEESWEKNYDAALNSNTCFTIHNPTFFSNDTIGYVLAGPTGINAQ